MNLISYYTYILNNVHCKLLRYSIYSKIVV
jgi:hypothetical protein